jgi:ArsR family transcriptional regulator, arsenate/arsenite/antimonite-responsive transcriptional repressor
VRISVAGTQESPPPKAVVRVLAALSDENRFRIVELLSREQADLPCGRIGQLLGLSPSLISHHLGVLEAAGVIERRKNGLWTLNRLRHEELSRHFAVLERLFRQVPVAQ